MQYLPFNALHTRLQKHTVLFLLLCLFLTCAISTLAQSNNKAQRFIYGRILNNVTRKDIIGAKVSRLAADSSAIDTCTVSDDINIGSERTVFALYVPKEGGNFLLRVEAEGYETRYVTIRVPAFGSRTLVYKVSDILMKIKKSDIVLGGAVVKATKIKFYHRGDTIVYNADAFNLSEGSMLDALIRQLPGAVLKENGEIFINGEKVENLLLNGENFFGKNNQLMLDNLPAYTVKNIQVYKRSTKRSQFFGHDLDERELSMNVTLKHQYNEGWIGNVEAGAGSESRYLGRLFSMRYTDHSSVSVFANINNLNDKRQPGQEGGWTPEKMPEGRVATKMGGLNYTINDRRKRYKLTGNATLSHSDGDMLTRTSGENFLPQGSTFLQSQTTSRSRQTKFSSSHEWEFKSGTIAQNEVDFNFSYTKWRNGADAATATFTESPFHLGVGLIDSIRRPTAGPLLRSLALNRQLSQTLNRGHEYNFHFYPQLFMKGAANDLVILQYEGTFRGKSQDNFSNTLYDYPRQGTEATDYRRQWDPTGDYSRRHQLIAGYSFVFPNGAIWTNIVGYVHSNSNTRNPFYRLDSLAHWGAAEGHAIGELPSETDFRLRTADPQNSLWYHATTNTPLIQSQISWNTINKNSVNNNWWRIFVQNTVMFFNNKMDYLRGSVNGTKKQHILFTNPEVHVKHAWNSWQRYWDFSYDGNYSPTDATNLIDILNSRDPLNLYRGNEKQKGSFTHSINYRYSTSLKRQQLMWDAAVGYTIVSNAQAYGYLYNRNTGARIYRPDNVNGNYVLTGELNWQGPIDKAKRLTLSQSFNTSYRQSVDLIGYVTSNEATWAEAVRSNVHTTDINEKIELKYSMGKSTFGTSGRVEWMQATSKREGFETARVWDFNYGLNATTELPWQIQISTDVTMFSRRGYDNPGSNTNDLLWNARIAKRMMHGQMTFAIDGFDILGQLSNISQTMNSQGRFETYRNVLPRYIMAHFIYRLNLKPKNERRTDGANK